MKVIPFVQARHFSIFLGGVRDKNFSATFVQIGFVDQMVLGPVSCPAKIHCTAVFAL